MVLVKYDLGGAELPAALVEDDFGGAGRPAAPAKLGEQLLYTGEKEKFTKCELRS